jgi:hypothetical protein
VPYSISEPEHFDKKCRTKGNAWLIENPGAKRPKDLWSPFRLALADGFANRCGYGAMYIPSGTVDHFVSCDEDRDMSYEWSNYRYVDGWINSAKSKKKSTDLLDPFEIEDGWFEVILPSLQLVLTDAVPEGHRVKAEKTLRDLPIRDDERLVRTRREWLRMFEENELNLEGLWKKAPLIAAAIEKKLALELT